MTPTHATDEVLGTVRYCPTCADWWPDDAEFWESDATRCRACVVERTERRRAQVRLAARRYRQRQAAWS